MTAEEPLSYEFQTAYIIVSSQQGYSAHFLNSQNLGASER